MPTHLRLTCSLLLLMAAAVSAAEVASPLFVVHFETGPAWNAALEPSAQPSFKEHSANLARLRKEGAIRFGARYGDFGMIFLEAPSLEKARELIEADPGVRAGTFIFRIAPLNVFYPWKEKPDAQ